MSKHPDNLIQEIVFYFKYDAADEIKALGKWFRYYLALWVVLIFAFFITAAAFNYGTTERVVIGYAQAGSSYRALAESIQTFFKKNDLDLSLSAVAHLNESARLLRKEAGSVNASLVLAGNSVPAGENSLVSLGSVAYAPGWLFYRGSPITASNPFTAMRDFRISIGEKDSYSNRAFRLLNEISNNQSNTLMLYELSDSNGVKALVNGEIDAIWVVDSFDSNNVKQLIKEKNLQIYDWQLADAYIEKFPFLTKINLPAGTFDLADVRPARDVTLLGTSVTLLVEKSLHPAGQWALLLAIRDMQLHAKSSLSGATSFPQYTDKSIPLSSPAERYYQSGVPAIFEYLPIYYASLIERTWVWMIGLFVFGYPVFSKLMHLRGVHAQWAMIRNFEILRSYEEAVVDAESEQELQDLVAQVANFEKEMLRHWVDEENIKDYYLLRAAFGRVRECISICAEKLNKAHISPSTTSN